MVKRHRVIVSTVMDTHRSAKRQTFDTEKHNQNNDPLPQHLPDSPVSYKIRQRHLTTVMYNDTHQQQPRQCTSTPYTRSVAQAVCHFF